MCFEEPQVAPTGRYPINETCRLLGIHRNTLLKYTSSGLIKCSLHRHNCRKFYKGSEILRFYRAVR